MKLRLLVGFILMAARDAWSWTMTIEPNNTRVRPGGTLDVMCRADVALSGCGFQVGDQGYYEFSQGAKSKAASKALCPCGVSVEIRDKDWCANKQLNAFLSVARGSCEEPRWVELGYCGGPSDQKPIVLIGKGLTFESGGLCLGKCKKMSERRGEMGGAAVCVAVMKAAATLSLPLNLNAVIPLCENMVSGMTMKPGDHCFTLGNGKSIQIDMTDNEGRIVLADAILYANQVFKPRMIIDVGSQTNGIRSALGFTATGVFANNDALWKQMKKAGAVTGDRVWRMPLWKHYTKRVTKVRAADMTNVGQGHGAPCRAAAFLRVTMQKRNNQTNGRPVFSAQYHGGGLDKGECGLKLSQLSEHGANYYVGCRARTVDGGWKYKITSFVVHSSASLPLKMSPKQAVVHPGKPISFVCKADSPLRMCSVDLPSQEDTLVTSNVTPDALWTDNYRQGGAGLKEGQCGLTIVAAVDADSGIVWCGADTKVDDISQRSAMLIVVRPPSRPPFLFLSKTSFAAGDILEATCSVWNARPRANITWFIGDKIVRKDSDDDSSVTDWRWPWDLQSITQILKVAVDVGDDAKELRCQASHPGLATPLEGKAPIAVAPRKAGDVSLPTKIGTGAATPADSKCGRRKASLQLSLHISNGELAGVGAYPWHAGVYRVLANGSSELECSGVLISTKIVLSVAHCFWNELLGRKNNASYAVGVGKIERGWGDADDAATEQHAAVVNIFLHDKYRGRKRNYQHDIAILQLATPVTLGDDVNVVCVDWEDKYEAVQLVAGSLGTVTGWGVTEDSVRSDTLKFVQLPYVDDNHCYDLLTENLQQLVTTDKFCAGFTNRSTSVCPGDSGGGLVYYDRPSQQFTLRGVVSIAFRPAENKELCYAQQVTGFTLVSAYRNWIKQILAANKIS